MYMIRSRYFVFCFRRL